ncbi:MAG: threonine synthase [Lentisphaerae bacterium]|nr:threonine synthase [Lentisphaerota bacterium]
MIFTSTRSQQEMTSAAAITRGIAADGGLFVPCEFPQLSFDKLIELSQVDYITRAKEVLKLYLTDYTEEEIDYCVRGAYSNTFDNNEPAPLVEVAPGTEMLELWHGPTCAFKDMALQLLPFLLVKAANKTAPGRTIVILVATSGDTGKAALAGFADVPNTRIVVFFPENGVSDMQKLQMTTQVGKNVAVCGIEGNFDDAQSGVKQIFTNDAIRNELDQMNMEFSSANSINFGRLVPQIVYYVSAACDLIKKGALKAGEKFNVAVPTGNFGDILAAYYAKQMGVPVDKLICASNRNKVLTDFLATGVYDRNREFYTTSSPSMDILISSNLERMIFHASGNDADLTAALMKELNEKGRYQLPPAVLEKLQSEFFGGFCDETGTENTIGDLFKNYHYLADTHTAVAANVLEQYRQATGDKTLTVIASTASPYKFAASVLPALTAEAVPEDGFAQLEMLSKLSDTPIPAPLAGLKGCAVLHKTCIAKDDMAKFVKDFLKK